MKTAASIVGALALFGLLGAWGARHSSNEASAAIDRAWRTVGRNLDAPNLELAWTPTGQTCFEYLLPSNRHVTLCFGPDGALTEAFDATEAGIRFDTVIPDASAAPVRVPVVALNRALVRIRLLRLGETAASIRHQLRICVDEATAAASAKTEARRLAGLAEATCGSALRSFERDELVASTLYPAFLPTIEASGGVVERMRALADSAAGRRTRAR